MSDGALMAKPLFPEAGAKDGELGEVSFELLLNRRGIARGSRGPVQVRQFNAGRIGDDD